MPFLLVVGGKKGDVVGVEVVLFLQRIVISRMYSSLTFKHECLNSCERVFNYGSCLHTSYVDSTCVCVVVRLSTFKM